MHLTDEEVAALVEGGLSRGDRKRIDEHLAACFDCAERLATHDRLALFLRDEETWEIASEIESQHAASRLSAFAEALRAEDAEAERLLAESEALVSPYKLVWANLHRRRRFRTGGVVRTLTRHANAECEKRPLHARNLADAAIAIAEALPSNLYPADAVELLRGNAWKERANACRYLGELKRALDDLDQAERAYRRVLCPDLHLAIVNYIRATILLDLERYDEAIALARGSAHEFARLGDTIRWTHAQLIVGVIFFESSQFADARDEFARLLRVVDMLDDLTLKARVEVNLANCEIELGEFGNASIRLCVALPLFEELALATEVARTRWTIGYLALRAGNTIDAERRLRAARDEMIRLNMGGDVSKITLDLVEALLAVGNTTEVPALLNDALRFFQEAGQLSSALTAIAYLREAVAAGRLTREMVEMVRRFIERAERKPELVFAPPPPNS